ncbi:MAG: hypothetical protein HZC40_10270 [Chloroflexi bacterium]|nr:hypothetical protein [Chloroflexota bacterium]
MNKKLLIGCGIAIALVVCVCICTFAVLLLMGPQIGNVFSQITRDLR